MKPLAEPTCHDNSLADADQVEGGYKGIGYDEIEHVTPGRRSRLGAIICASGDAIHL